MISTAMISTKCGERCSGAPAQVRYTYYGILTMVYLLWYAYCGMLTVAALLLKLDTHLARVQEGCTHAEGPARVDAREDVPTLGLRL